MLRTCGQTGMLRTGRIRGQGATSFMRMSLMGSLPSECSARLLSPAIDWTAFYDRLRGFVAARVRGGSDVDDLVQLILERAVAKASKTEIDSAAAWLFGIARNAIADHHRAQARTLITEADALDAEPALGSSDDERAAVIACMEPLLNCLPDETAQLLRWADMKEWSMQAIADELGITLTAAKSRVQRARKDFAKLTSDCCAITIDARGRVTHLTPRTDAGAIECDTCAPNSAKDTRTPS